MGNIFSTAGPSPALLVGLHKSARVHNLMLAIKTGAAMEVEYRRMNPGVTCCEACGLNITAMEISEQRAAKASMRFFSDYRRLLIAVPGAPEYRAHTATAVCQLLDAMLDEQGCESDARREIKVLAVVTDADQPEASTPEAVQREPGRNQNLGVETVFRPPEKNELVLSIGMGCADTVPFPREPNTPS